MTDEFNLPLVSQTRSQSGASALDALATAPVSPAVEIGRLLFSEAADSMRVKRLAALRIATSESERAALRVIQELREFWENIPDDHDQVALIHGKLQVHVTKVTFIEPSLLAFEGFTESGNVRVLQHISQLQLTMMSVPRDANTPKREIGFFVKSEAEPSPGASK